MASIPDFMVLSPQLMSLTFILKAFGSVLRRIDNQATDELFLNSGLYTGVATMIYLPAAVFFFVFLSALIFFSTAISRRLMLYIFGFLLVLGMGAVYFLWRGDFLVFSQSFFVLGLFQDGEMILDTWQLLLLSGPLVFVLIMTTLKALSSSRLTIFQQRVQQVIWFMFFGGLFCFLLTNKKTTLELVFFVPLIAYFLTHYFLLPKKRILQVLMPSFILVLLVGFSIYSYKNLTNDLLVEESPASRQKVLVLSEKFGYYLRKPAGSPCFSQPHCDTAFKGLDYYGAAANIYEWLKKSDPELIIDEMDLMPHIFLRFPLVEQSYRKTGTKSYIKISN